MSDTQENTGITLIGDIIAVLIKDHRGLSFERYRAARKALSVWHEDRKHEVVQNILPLLIAAYRPFIAPALLQSDELQVSNDWYTSEDEIWRVKVDAELESEMRAEGIKHARDLFGIPNKIDRSGNRELKAKRKSMDEAFSLFEAWYGHFPDGAVACEAAKGEYARLWQHYHEHRLFGDEAA